MRPKIGVFHGDPNGVGPEVTVKLLTDAEVRDRARIVLVGDRRVLAMAEKVVGQEVSCRVVDRLDEAAADGEDILFLDLPTIDPSDVTPGEATAAAGRACLETLREMLRLTTAGTLDGFCFAPLNKYALKLGGCPYEDEHVFFAREIGFDGPFCEHNVLGDLWTTRVTSHIPLGDVVPLITGERIGVAIGLAHNTLGSAGFKAPRIAVAALNPHAGDGGMFGRQEIDIIAPAVERARARGIDARGPFAPDTIFVKASDGEFDAVVTMYHDQGQIAMKLMGFKRGVTVTGGLPIPVTTPASGTAFDIVGQNIASAEGLKQAFMLVSRMAEIRRAKARAGPPGAKTAAE